MGVYATLSSKGQLTIPKEVRDQLHLREGTRFYITIRNGEIVAMPKNVQVSELSGMLGRPPSGEVLAVSTMERAVEGAVLEDHERVERQDGSQNS